MNLQSSESARQRSAPGAYAHHSLDVASTPTNTLTDRQHMSPELLDRCHKWPRVPGQGRDRVLLGRLHRDLLGLAGVFVIALVTGGCGNAVGGDGSSPAAPATAGDSVPTIETTLPNGGETMQFPMKSFDGMKRVAADSVPAPSDLPFNAAFPKSADAPMGVFVSIPADYPDGEEEVVAEYDASSPYGPFRVREEKTPKGLVDQSFIDQIPSICDTCTDARLVDVTSDIKAPSSPARTVRRA